MKISPWSPKYEGKGALGFGLKFEIPWPDRMKEKKYPNITKQEFLELKETLRRNKAILSDVTDHGFDYQVSTPLGYVSGVVNYQEPVLGILVKEKPFLVSYNSMFDYLDNLLSRYTDA